jgi:protein-tyrosine kinase
MAKGPDHLAERLAAHLGGVGGLGAKSESGEARRPADSGLASHPLPMPPPVLAEAPAAAEAAGDGHAHERSGLEGDRHEGDRHEGDRHEGDGHEGAIRSEAEALPPPPDVAAEAHAAEAPGSAGTLVMERPARRESARDELVAPPGVNLDTMVPAPLTLDLVSLERAGMVVGRKARTRISEEFRVSVGQILRSVRGSYTPGRGAGNLVMVTSARPGEGKSFTALNLAGSIAQHTQREVLLVDVDAKQNALSDQFGIGDRPGLIDLALTPSLRIEDTVVRTVIPNLSFLPVGVRRVDSLEGGAEGTVARPITALIERLGRRFANHIVILDAPPCLSTSDPSTIAPLVGQIVMVVEAERTQRSEVLAALDLIKACPTITMMLNKIQVTTSYTFGAYHYFGSYS